MVVVAVVALVEGLEQGVVGRLDLCWRARQAVRATRKRHSTHRDGTRARGLNERERVV